MSESEPQVPLTAQEWLKEAMRLADEHALWFSQSRDEPHPGRRAALLDHLAVRPQEQEAKDAARLDLLEARRMTSRAKGFQWDSWTYDALQSEKTIREQLDAAIAAQAAQPKDAA